MNVTSDKIGPNHQQSTVPTTSSPSNPKNQMPPATEQLRGERSTTLKFEATRFWIATLTTAISVLFLFTLNVSYLFGSTFQSARKSHAFNILFVDYDHGGTVSQSVLAAYQQLKGPTFPKIIIGNSTQYPTTESLIDAVQAQKYWGAMFVLQGASSRLEDAVRPHPATLYNASNAIAYIWNEIRYPAISASVVRPNILQLVVFTQAVWQQSPFAMTSLVSSIAANNTKRALEVYTNPIQAMEINPWPAAQMAKVFYNTVAMAMPIVQQNMFLIPFNAIATKLNFFTKFSVRTTASLVFCISLVFTLLGALTTTSYIWAFREDWGVGGRQFIETWMLLWLAMHIYYLFLDAALAVFHMAFYPVIIITFIFLNITSACFPLELSPGFYRWGQSLPAYAALQVLLDIWSYSSAKLQQNLPVLFAWWIVSICLAAYGVSRRWKLANHNVSSA